jgi:hypothetical protein
MNDNSSSKAVLGFLGVILSALIAGFFLLVSVGKHKMSFST